MKKPIQFLLIIGIFLPTFLCAGETLEPKTGVSKPNDAIDPFSDKNITCEEMRTHSDLIFMRDGIDLGSGHGSPIDVEYECLESIQLLPEVKELYRLAFNIRNEERSQCAGSIIHAHWRYYHFSLLEASFAPKQKEDYIKRSLEDEYASVWAKKMIYKNSPTFSYLKEWGMKSPSNYNLYIKFLDQVDKSIAQLTKYYKSAFRFSSKDAKKYAEFSVMEIVNWAGGSYPYDWVMQADIPSSEINLSDMRKFLSAATQNQIVQFLNLNLAENKSSKRIAEILPYVKSLNVLNESPVFFSLGNKSNVELLVKHGADINYQNQFGKTALYYAIGNNDHKIVNLLISLGANVNHRYKSKSELSSLVDYYECFFPVHTERTPLMHAAQHADSNMLKILLDAGADVYAFDGLQENAIDYAIRSKNKGNAAYLKTNFPLVSIKNFNISKESNNQEDFCDPIFYSFSRLPKSSDQNNMQAPNLCPVFYDNYKISTFEHPVWEIVNHDSDLIRAIFISSGIVRDLFGKNDELRKKYAQSDSSYEDFIWNIYGNSVIKLIKNTPNSLQKFLIDVDNDSQVDTIYRMMIDVKNMSGEANRSYNRLFCVDNSVYTFYSENPALQERLRFHSYMHSQLMVNNRKPFFLNMIDLNTVSLNEFKNTKTEGKAELLSIENACYFSVDYYFNP